MFKHIEKARDDINAALQKINGIFQEMPPPEQTFEHVFRERLGNAKTQLENALEVISNM